MNDSWKAWSRTGLVVGLTLMLGGCGGEPAERTTQELSADDRVGGLAVACSQAAFETLNAFVSPDLGAAELLGVLFTPLVRYATDASLEPYLATDWRWEDDGRRLVVTIRPDMTWHDGARLTADDVAWTLNAAADPEYGSPRHDDFAALTSAVARDSVTVELTFSEPQAGVEAFVALPILPRHLLSEIPPAEFSRASYHREPVGSGPFRYEGRREDGSLILVRAERFPAELGRVYLDRLVVRAIQEVTTLAAELETGGVDMCMTGTGMAERLQGSDRLEILPLEPPQTQIIPLNLESAPLDDARVRRALSAALRRADIAAVASPLARPARSPLPESSPWFDPAFGQPDADTALARRLLEEAGWARVGEDGIRRNETDAELRFTLVGPAPLETLLTVVQDQLRAVGVGVELRFMEWSAYVGLLQAPERRPAAMALALQPEKVLNAADELHDQLHSDGFSNLSGYSAVDSLLGLLVDTRDSERQRELAAEIQRQVAEDVPVLYTVYLPRLVVVGDRLQGVEADLNGAFGSVAHWWIPPERRRSRI